ncbi:MAG: urease accessory protein UreJ, partial [Betaproteobacteria bacterium HGW-Betaproteobacteria-17]
MPEIHSHGAFAATTGLLLVASTSALAHHPMGGMTPQTLSQGLLSGLGHPVIGLDHLAF